MLTRSDKPCSTNSKEGNHHWISAGFTSKAEAIAVIVEGKGSFLPDSIRLMVAVLTPIFWARPS